VYQFIIKENQDQANLITGGIFQNNIPEPKRKELIRVTTISKNEKIRELDDWSEQSSGRDTEKEVNKKDSEQIKSIIKGIFNIKFSLIRLE